MVGKGSESLSRCEIEDLDLMELETFSSGVVLAVGDMMKVGNQSLRGKGELSPDDGRFLRGES